jgi:hypothetical protein
MSGLWPINDLAIAELEIPNVGNPSKFGSSRRQKELTVDVLNPSKNLILCNAFVLNRTFPLRCLK